MHAFARPNVGNIGGPGAIRSFSGTMISAYWGNTTQAPTTNCIGLQAIVDGTSNTALFSERLMGITGNPQVTIGDKNNAKRAIFEVPTAAAVNGNDTAGANAVLNACKSKTSGVPAAHSRSVLMVRPP